MQLSDQVHFLFFLVHPYSARQELPQQRVVEAVKRESSLAGGQIGGRIGDQIGGRIGGQIGGQIGDQIGWKRRLGKSFPGLGRRDGR